MMTTAPLASAHGATRFLTGDNDPITATGVPHGQRSEALSAMRPGAGATHESAFRPRVAHGLLHRYRDPEWRVHKDAIAQAALDAAFTAFVVDDPDPRRSIASALQGELAKVPPKHSRAAIAYARKKAGQVRHFRQLVDGRLIGSTFSTKGTDLAQPIDRTAEGTVHRMLNEVSAVDRARIGAQTGVPYHRDAQLGTGHFSVVRLAETMPAIGRPGAFVACKIARELPSARGSVKREIATIRALPASDKFTRLRESLLGKRQPRILIDLAAGGSARALHFRLRATHLLTDDEKTRLRVALAWQYITQIAELHDMPRPVYHRDNYPRNILIAPEAGSNTRILLGDFGIALQAPDLGLHPAHALEHGDRARLRRTLCHLYKGGNESRLRELDEQGRLDEGLSPAWKELMNELRNPAVPLRDILRNDIFAGRLDDAEMTSLLHRVLDDGPDVLPGAPNR